MKTSSISLEQHLTEVNKLTAEISYLKEQLTWFRRQIFSQSTEKVIENDSQLSLNIEIPKLPETQAKEISAHTRRSKAKGSATITFPDDLPIQRTIIDLKDEEKICSISGHPLVERLRGSGARNITPTQIVSCLIV